MILIVDVQGFNIPEFVAKEIAVMSRNGKKLLHLIISPPVPYRKLSKNVKNQVQWLYQNYHGLKWNEGYISYVKMEDIIKNIFNNATTIFVKGDIKKIFIEKYFNGEVIDFMHLPSMKKCQLQKQCFAHKVPFVCSLNNVHVLKTLLDEEYLHQTATKCLELNIL